ncbi:hypothetical protein [Allohahella marinimesophila]
MKSIGPPLTAAVFGLLPLTTSTASSEQTDPLFGSAAHDQTIRLAMDDDRFDGQAGEVHAGDTVRFVITNRSGLDHGFMVGERDEFSIATTAYIHEAEASDGGGHRHKLPESADAASPLVKQVSESPSLDIPSGLTRELLVHFPRPGEFRFTCPLDNHADSGMSGIVNVLPADASS